MAASKSTHGVVTDCMTLTRFLLEEQRKYPGASGDLTQLMSSVLTAIKAVGTSVRRAGLSSLYGLEGHSNVQGEEVKKLDIVANELFINMLRSSFKVAMMVSEENDQPIAADAPADASTADPEIIEIAPDLQNTSGPATTADALQPGRSIVAAGYAVYGSATAVVLATPGSSVNIFQLDTSIGEFILSHANVRVKPRGKIYSINEGNEREWDEPVKEFIHSKKHPPPGPDGKPAKPYAARYVGSMVADIHRTLLYGGVFCYPAGHDSPDGKLRLLYECNPMAFIVEMAGGMATTGRMPILDIMPKKIHQRAPIFLGSRDDVQEIIDLYKKFDAKHGAPKS